MYTESQVNNVLQEIGLDIQAEAGEDWLVFCPYHSNYRTPAGEVSKETGIFYCFSCNTTVQLHDLVMRMTGRTYFEALRLIKKYQVATNLVDSVDNSLQIVEDPPFDSGLIERLHQDCLSSKRAIDYFTSRMITPSSIEWYQLGYSVNQDMVTVPLHDAVGKPVGFVGRSILGKSFKYTHGLKVSNIIFNLHRVKSSPSVIVVESSFDAIRLGQRSLAAVATLGSGISNKKIDMLLKYFPHIVLIPDKDEAGKKMTDKIVQKAGRRAVVIKLPPGAKDVGDLSNAQIEKLAHALDNPLVGIV